jgi:hypothetical protein
VVSARELTAIWRKASDEDAHQRYTELLEVKLRAKARYDGRARRD